MLYIIFLHVMRDSVLLSSDNYLLLKIVSPTIYLRVVVFIHHKQVVDTDT